jgi:hypothetical protein
LRPSTNDTTAESAPATNAEPTTIVPASLPRQSAQGSRWINRAKLRAMIGQITGGEVGVSVVPLSTGRPFTAGPAQVGAGWSTMKIPVIIARYRLAKHSGEPFDGLTARVTRAITESDNAAAMSLFSDLEARKGGLAGASLSVQQVLRDAGDPDTTVNTRQLDSGFSTFGQTQWPLLAGTRFFRALAGGCLAPRDAAKLIIDLMGQIVPSQSWGLGQANFSGARVYLKGGWGPNPSGAHLVRQFGIVVDEHNRGFAVGLMAKPADGSFRSGVTLLERLAIAVAATTSATKTPPPGAE